MTPPWKPRPDQIEPPGDWRTWLYRGGRGCGKGRLGAETVNRWAMSGAVPYILIGGPTAEEVRHLQIEGESGILKVSHPGCAPEYIPSKNALRWPSGATGLIRYGDEPDTFRGFDGRAWLDELFSWKHAEECWRNVLFGLRHETSRALITATPRGTPLMHSILADPGTHDTQVRTSANHENLDPIWLLNVTSQYRGTRLGAQELDGELVEGEA